MDFINTIFSSVYELDILGVSQSRDRIISQSTAYISSCIYFCGVIILHLHIDRCCPQLFSFPSFKKI